MKKWSILLVALMLFGIGQVAVSEAAIEVEGDAYVGVFDKYLWRGTNLSESRPVIQGGIDLSAGNWTLSTWHNWQLKSGSTLQSGELNETDIILNYDFAVGDMLSFSVGDIWYALEGAEDTNELYLVSTLNTMLTPTLSIYWDWDGAEEEGLFFTFDVSHSMDLMEGLALNLGALVSYNLHNDKAFVADYSGLHNYELSAGLDYALTDQLVVSPSFTFSSGISDAAKDEGEIDTETLAAVNLTFTF